MAESSVRDTALGGADTAGSRGGLFGRRRRSVGGYGGPDFFHLKVLALERVNPENIEIIALITAYNAKVFGMMTSRGRSHNP